MNSYTLDQLALFDRCLFPAGFRDELIAVGSDEFFAIEVCNFIINSRQKGNIVGIIQIYQEYIHYKGCIDLIEKVVYNFFNR